MLNFLTNVVIVLMSTATTIYLLWIRTKRDSIMKKYQPGTQSHALVKMLFEKKYIFGSALITCIFTSGLIVDRDKNFDYIKRIADDWPPFVFLLLVGMFIGIQSFLKFRKK